MTVIVAGGFVLGSGGALFNVNTDQFLTSASYSGSPQPVSFLVSIDNGPQISTAASLDGSSNAYLNFDLTANGYLPGSGSHVANVIAVDSSGNLSTTTQYSFTL